MSFTLSATLLIIAVVVILYGIGSRRMIAWFGNPDLGEVDFMLLKRSKTPNDAVVAPETFERFKALRPELTSPIYEVMPAQLFKAIDERLLAMPETERVSFNETVLVARYVVRTPTIGWPDTVNIKIIPHGPGRSAILASSRAKFGMRDFGVNKARLEALIAGLNEQMSTE
jgi:uncharacterized protein (DUF1499 family)